MTSPSKRKGDTAELEAARMLADAERQLGAGDDLLDNALDNVRRGVEGVKTAPSVAPPAADGQPPVVTTAPAFLASELSMPGAFVPESPEVSAARVDEMVEALWANERRRKLGLVAVAVVVVSALATTCTSSLIILPC
jgi:hypothetical protein